MSKAASMSTALRADLILVLVTLLAACGWIFSKQALQGLPPFLFIAIRFSCAGVLLLAVTRPGLKPLSIRQLGHILATGVLFAAALALWILGLHHTRNLGIGAFLTSLAIVMVPLTGLLLFREPVGRQNWLAIPVSTLGLGLLALQQPSGFDSGQLFFLLAAVLFSVHFTVTGHLVRSLPVLPLTALQLLCAGVIGALLSLVFESLPANIDPLIWWWVAASIVIATSMRFSLQTYAQSLATSSHAAIILTLEPVLTSLLAAFWYAESMSLLQLCGCSLIFTALLIARWPQVKQLLSYR